MADTPLGWYKWYPRDFAQSPTVKSMSFMARAIYRELLDLQWESNCLANVKRLPSTIGVTLEPCFSLYMLGIVNGVKVVNPEAFEEGQG